MRGLSLLQLAPHQLPFGCMAVGLFLEFFFVLGILSHRTNETPMSYRMAMALVFSKVKSALGLDRCHSFISGAAPLNKETSEFFLSLDIPIGDMYGLSESSGPHTIPIQESYRIRRYQTPRQTPSPPATWGSGAKGGRAGKPLS